MELKIFLLIATFFISQVKSYTDDFAKAVLLTDAKSLWGNDNSKHKSFQNCYKKRNEGYKEAVVTFSLNLFEAGNTMHNYLGSKQDFKRRTLRIKECTNELGNFLKEYQEKFSDKVRNGDFGDIHMLMRGYESKIENKLNKLFSELLDLKDSTAWGLYLKNMKSGEKTIENEIEEVTKQCKEIMKKLKECLSSKRESK